MRFSYSLLPLLLLAITQCTTSNAQWTPAVNAIKLPDSLIFTSNTANNNCTVVWHPVLQRYYSLRIGAANFPLETWVLGSSTSVCVATTAIDSRGMWYNPATNTIERNCLGALGWATFGIDAGSCATGAFTTIFPGQLQATAQSCAAFDPVLNEVLTYSAATTSVEFRDRATGTLVQALLLTGTSFANVNTESIIWTGQAGYEIGLLNWATKRVFLFSRATGAFTGQSQLPAAAVTHTQFRFCYTNNRVWLFNATLRKWNAYCIWQQTCGMDVLPVELLAFNATCDGTPSLTWSTGSEQNSSHFEIERSTDAREWTFAGRVESAANSQQLIEYAWSDPEPLHAPVVYYRLRQVDLDGGDELFDVLTVSGCGTRSSTITAYPNPTTDLLHVSINVKEAIEGGRLELRDAMGRPVSRRSYRSRLGETAPVRLEWAGSRSIPASIHRCAGRYG
ncbi:MAG: hypothetical protein IPF41_12345 [Flavobacteriales bacterium]|nr:hypothetical protein [Flavobacteriales bacterium]